MQKARRHPTKGLRPLVSTRFQVLFTPLFGVLFTFPSQYWFTIGLSGVFSLTGWCRQIPTRRLRPRGTQDTTNLLLLTRTQLSCSMARFPTRFRFILISMLWSYYPVPAVTGMVWASSISLATTLEITVVFSSSAYLDVSVQQVSALLQSIFNRLGFPIRKSADQFIFADPHGLSQLITSFFASESLGIPRVPFLTFFYALRFCS